MKMFFQTSSIPCHFLFVNNTLHVVSYHIRMNIRQSSSTAKICHVPIPILLTKVEKRMKQTFPFHWSDGVRRLSLRKCEDWAKPNQTHQPRMGNPYYYNKPIKPDLSPIKYGLNPFSNIIQPTRLNMSRMRGWLKSESQFPGLI